MGYQQALSLPADGILVRPALAFAEESWPSIPVKYFRVHQPDH